MKNRCQFTKILGLKVLFVRGERGYDYRGFRERRKYGFKPVYILFDDKKTYLKLEEQDYHAFHDCSSTAREIEVKQDEQMWAMIEGDLWSYPVADLSNN